MYTFILQANHWIEVTEGGKNEEKIALLKQEHSFEIYELGYFYVPKH